MQIILKVMVQRGIVKKVVPRSQAPEWLMDSIDEHPHTDAIIANALAEYGWELKNILTVADNTHDKELWFVKNEQS